MGVAAFPVFTMLMVTQIHVKLDRPSSIIQGSQSLMPGYTTETQGWIHIYIYICSNKLVSPSVEVLEDHSVLSTMMQVDEEVRLLFQSNLFLIV